MSDTYLLIASQLKTLLYERIDHWFHQSFTYCRSKAKQQKYYLLQISRLASCMQHWNNIVPYGNITTDEQLILVISLDI